MQNASMLIGFIATCIAVGGSILGILYSVHKVANRVESAIGKDNQGRTITERMEKVEYQLWENGGESLADKVNEIEKTSIKTAAEITFIKQVLLQLLSLPDMVSSNEIEKVNVKTRTKK